MDRSKLSFSDNINQAKEIIAVIEIGIVILTKILFVNIVWSGEHRAFVIRAYFK